MIRSEVLGEWVLPLEWRDQLIDHVQLLEGPAYPSPW